MQKVDPIPNLRDSYEIKYTRAGKIWELKYTESRKIMKGWIQISSNNIKISNHHAVMHFLSLHNPTKDKFWSQNNRSKILYAFPLQENNSKRNSKMGNKSTSPYFMESSTLHTWEPPVNKECTNTDPLWNEYQFCQLFTHKEYALTPSKITKVKCHWYRYKAKKWNYNVQ